MFSVSILILLYDICVYYYCQILGCIQDNVRVNVTLSLCLVVSVVLLYDQVKVATCLLRQIK